MKKTLKIILIILLITGFAIFLLWILNPGDQNGSQNFLRTVREFIPFGGNQDTEEELPIPPDEEFFAGGEELVGGKRSIGAILPDIEQVYRDPVAGFTILGTSTPIVRVVERATGHIIDIDTITQEQIRVSNTTLPGIRKALFLSGGEKVLMQYVRQDSNIVETIVIEDVGQEDQTSGTYLDENIISIIPGGMSEIIYMVPNNIGSNIISYNTDSKTKKTISSVPLRQIHLLRVTNTHIYFETKATYTSKGYLYRIPRSGGSLQKITEGLAGLNNTLGENGNIVWSTYGGSAAYSSLLNQETGDLVTYNLKTIASKCVVGSEYVYCGVPNFYGNTMPDNWFMGTIELVDSLTRINIETGNVTKIMDLTNTDVVEPKLRNENLFFSNKKDGSVWIVRLNQIQS